MTPSGVQGRCRCPFLGHPSRPVDLPGLTSFVVHRLSTERHRRTIPAFGRILLLAKQRIRRWFPGQ